MAWTVPPSWSTSQLVTATQMQVLSDDLAYLLNRPNNSIKRDNGSSYTTTSTSFTDLDGTNIKITMSISGSAVLLGFTAVILGGAAVADAGSPYFDFDIDGTRFASAGTDGYFRAGYNSSSAAQAVSNVSMTALVTGLSTGSHTFKVKWKVASGTATLFSGSGSGGSDYIPDFWAVEVA